MVYHEGSPPEDAKECLAPQIVNRFHMTDVGLALDEYLEKWIQPAFGYEEQVPLKGLSEEA